MVMSYALGIEAVAGHRAVSTDMLPGAATNGSSLMVAMAVTRHTDTIADSLLKRPPIPGSFEDLSHLPFS